jgi:L-ascorbate metabolism protein UlaG (beta-lactamase superfamily)
VLRLVSLICLAAWVALLSPAPAGAEPERCPRLVSSAGPTALPVAFLAAATEAQLVTITFLGHASFAIESPRGVSIVTDYSDATRPERPPTVATMNIAHITHYSVNPDPAIPHLLRGWGDDAPASYDLTVDDVWVRNVTTDLRGMDGDITAGGANRNSMFVFEVAGLCIAHLGHLQHPLTKEHLNALGRIDVVLAPVDGSYTLSVDSMIGVLRAISAPLVIPMHYFGPQSLQRFVSRLDETYAVQVSDTPTVRLSRETLPGAPTVLVLPGF